MMWTAIGCLIAGFILLIAMFIWSAASKKDPAKRQSFKKWQGTMQVCYLLFFMAAAVLFLIW